ncbi:hypothetical protein SAMN05660473_04246 [Arthrobacter sp. 49Tsu3.1M3]|nr:hypothetical protein SAMN05660473_04246 [Arthrobacter sp. 49Tsu3.1M3]
MSAVLEIAPPAPAAVPAGLRRGACAAPGLAAPRGHVFAGSAPPGAGRREFAFEAPVGCFEFEDEADSGQV